MRFCPTTSARCPPPVFYQFPCKQSINSHMHSIIIDRHQAFIEFENWPRERIAAYPKLIADAGFYHLGDGDRTKCWYCNEGLKNWERFNDPWIEHAKWFLLCEFLLKNRGVDFVKDFVKGFVSLNRPPVPNPPTQNQTSRFGKISQLPHPCKTPTTVPSPHRT